VLTGRIGRDHGLRTVHGQPVSELPRVISPISKEISWRWDEPQNLCGSDEIVGVSGRDDEAARTPLVVRQGVDFCRAPAARGSNGLDEGPPFAPAADRCALT
jgi:hypothetical protein